MSTYTRRLVFLSCWGVIAGIALWGIAWALAITAGLHGSQLPFTVLFPWSHFLYRIALFGDHTWALSIVMFVQLPLYALVLGAFWQTKRRTFLLGALLLAHVLAVTACFLPETFYQSFW